MSKMPIRSWKKLPNMRNGRKKIVCPYFVGELGRRFSFEYNGMRNHEVYFSSFEGGAKNAHGQEPAQKNDR